MVKYEIIDDDTWTNIDPNIVGAWYKIPESTIERYDYDEHFGADYFHVIEKGMMVNYDCVAKEGGDVEFIYFTHTGSLWEVVHNEVHDDEAVRKEMFKLELELRRTSIWRAINE